mmetsp:Transcript_88068/g.251325  ORF Transcript_88068/g.251325 Transcript_88068/m.251325 type:complete len:299 (-) Transcript_88068:182-1078(-)
MVATFVAPVFDHTRLLEKEIFDLGPDNGRGALFVRDLRPPTKARRVVVHFGLGVAKRLQQRGGLLQLTLKGIGVNSLRVNSVQSDVGEGPATLRRGGGRRRNGCRASRGTQLREVVNNDLCRVSLAGTGFTADEHRLATLTLHHLCMHVLRDRLEARRFVLVVEIEVQWRPLDVLLRPIDVAVGVDRDQNVTGVSVNLSIAEPSLEEVEERALVEIGHLTNVVMVQSVRRVPWMRHCELDLDLLAVLSGHHHVLAVGTGLHARHEGPDLLLGRDPHLNADVRQRLDLVINHCLHHNLM